MAIRLRFTREAALTSRIIAYAGAGEFSHVGYLLDDGSELGARSDHVGGKPPGVQIRPPNYGKFVRAAIFTIQTVPEREARFKSFLFSQIGKPYDNAAIWGFVTGRDWRVQGSWICSELQAAALESSAIVFPLYLACNKVSPTTLAAIVSAIGAPRIDNP